MVRPVFSTSSMSNLFLGFPEFSPWGSVLEVVSVVGSRGADRSLHLLLPSSLSPARWDQRSLSWLLLLFLHYTTELSVPSRNLQIWGCLFIISWVSKFSDSPNPWKPYCLSFTSSRMADDLPLGVSSLVLLAQSGVPGDTPSCYFLIDAVFLSLLLCQYWWQIQRYYNYAAANLLPRSPIDWNVECVPDLKLWF